MPVCHIVRSEKMPDMLWYALHGTWILSVVIPLAVGWLTTIYFGAVAKFAPIIVWLCVAAWTQFCLWTHLSCRDGPGMRKLAKHFPSAWRGLCLAHFLVQMLSCAVVVCSFLGPYYGLVNEAQRGIPVAKAHSIASLEGGVKEPTMYHLSNAFFKREFSTVAPQTLDMRGSGGPNAPSSRMHYSLSLTPLFAASVSASPHSSVGGLIKNNSSSTSSSTGAVVGWAISEGTLVTAAGDGIADARLDAVSDSAEARRRRVASWNELIQKGCDDKAGKHWAICGVATSNWTDILKYLPGTSGWYLPGSIHVSKNWFDDTTRKIATAHGLTAPKNPVLLIIMDLARNQAAIRSVEFLVADSVLIVVAMLLAWHAATSPAYEPLDSTLDAGPV